MGSGFKSSSGATDGCSPDVYSVFLEILFASFFNSDAKAKNSGPFLERLFETPRGFRRIFCSLDSLVAIPICQGHVPLMPTSLSTSAATCGEVGPGKTAVGVRRSTCLGAWRITAPARCRGMGTVSTAASEPLTLLGAKPRPHIASLAETRASAAGRAFCFPLVRNAKPKKRRRARREKTVPSGIRTVTLSITHAI